MVFLKGFADTDDNEKILIMIGISKWFDFRVNYNDTKNYCLFNGV